MNAQARKKLRERNLAIRQYRRLANEPLPARLSPASFSASLTHARAGYTYQRHQHTTYETIYLLQGKYRCFLNDREMFLRPDQILVVKPGDWHEDSLAKGTRCLGVGFRLKNAAADQRSIGLFRTPLPPQAQVLTAEPEVFRPLIARITEEHLPRELVGSQIQDALLHEYFWRLVRAIPRRILSREFLTRFVEEGFAARIHKLFRARYTGNWTSTELARAMGMGKSQLFSHANRILGMSPLRAFQQFKMDRAARLLRETSMSIKEISAFLAFKDQYHFSRAFKARHRVPPSEYRASSAE